MTISYLATDKHGRHFSGLEIKPGESYETDNPNYIFTPYKDLNVAELMQPSFEGLLEPRFWEVESFEKIGEDKARRHYSKIRCVAESARPNITDQQRFRFAALLCLNIVGNKEVRNWVLGCLDESNGSPETARSFSGRLMSMISEDLDPSEAYISPAHPLSNAVSSGAYVRMCAYSSHRSACDSPDILDLQAFAKASVSMTKDQVLRSAGA